MEARSETTVKNGNRFPVEELLAWYRVNARILPWRGTSDLYGIWVSEVMLQQTQVSAVIPFYRRFMERFPTVRDLADAPEQEALKLWEGLGYYSRCRNLQKAARMVVEAMNGEVPGNYDQFRSLPGVGPYIAAAVLSIGLNQRIPAVDGNVIRVYARFRVLDEDSRSGRFRTLVFNALREVTPEAAGDFTQALMELGALICTPQNPACNDCPLGGECLARARGTAHLFPVRTSAKKIPFYQVAVAVIVDGERFYVQQRPSRGHLGGLWEFPGGKTETGETPEMALIRECREELNCEVGIVAALPPVRHVYSHFKIELFPFVCRIISGAALPPENTPHRWISIPEIDGLPFPGANHKIFPALKDYFLQLSLSAAKTGGDR